MTNRLSTDSTEADAMKEKNKWIIGKQHSNGIIVISDDQMVLAVMAQNNCAGELGPVPGKIFAGYTFQTKGAYCCATLNYDRPDGDNGYTLFLFPKQRFTPQGAMDTLKDILKQWVPDFECTDTPILPTWN